MTKFGFTLPIVGMAYVEVEANTKEEGLQKALETPWEELDILEMYVTDHVGQGNVTFHSCHDYDCEEL